MSAYLRRCDVSTFQLMHKPRVKKEMVPRTSRLFSHGAASGILVRNCSEKAINFVTWEKPGKGWTKMNYDGSCKCKTGKASIGGVFRDHNAKFMLGYAESIGQSNSTIAELAALLRGLEIAIENGWSDIWLEGDSKSLVDMLSKKGRAAKCTEVEKHMERINLIIPKINNYKLTHVYREGNRAAHKFAQVGHHLNKPKIWRQIPPNQLLRILSEDAQGKPFVRTR